VFFKVGSVATSVALVWLCMAFKLTTHLKHLTPR